MQRMEINLRTNRDRTTVAAFEDAFNTTSELLAENHIIDAGFAAVYEDFGRPPVMSEDDLLLLRGVAKCSDGEKFDYAVGEDIAAGRLVKTYHRRMAADYMRIAGELEASAGRMRAEAERHKKKAENLDASLSRMKNVSGKVASFKQGVKKNNNKKNNSQSKRKNNA